MWCERPKRATSAARRGLTVEEPSHLVALAAAKARAKGASQNNWKILSLRAEGRSLKTHTGYFATRPKELAIRAGFSERTNFVKFFRLHAGETPLAFRARFHHSSSGSYLDAQNGRR